MVGRRIAVVRHGERVDFTFTDDWINACFSNNDTSTYTKHNLNMPDTVPRRSHPQLFIRDCPLTEIGQIQATLTGKGLQEGKVLRDGFQVYVSPALRCVQTATAVGKGMGLDFDLKIEPTLFEWMGWFRDIMPRWMSVDEYCENGYKIDTAYLPFGKTDDLSVDEGCDELYHRSHRFIEHIINSSDNDILLVAHGCSLDCFTRQLIGGSVRDMSSMMGVLRGVPYCGSAVIELDEASKKWSLLPVSGFLTMKHGGNQDFDASRALDNPPDFTPLSYAHT